MILYYAGDAQPRTSRRHARAVTMHSTWCGQLPARPCHVGKPTTPATLPRWLATGCSNHHCLAAEPAAEATPPHRQQQPQKAAGPKAAWGLSRVTCPVKLTQRNADDEVEQRIEIHLLGIANNSSHGSGAIPRRTFKNRTHRSRPWGGLFCTTESSITH